MLRLRPSSQPSKTLVDFFIIPLTSLSHQWSDHGLNGVFVKPTLAQEPCDSVTTLRRTDLPSHRDHLHGQIPFTYLAVGGSQSRLHDRFRATSGEQLFLQTRTRHRHAYEPPVCPPRGEGNIIDVFQRSQPSNYRANLQGRGPLCRKQSFDLNLRAITTGQSTHCELQPRIGRRCRFACHSPALMEG